MSVITYRTAIWIIDDERNLQNDLFHFTCTIKGCLDATLFVYGLALDNNRFLALSLIQNINGGMDNE